MTQAHTTATLPAKAAAEEGARARKARKEQAATLRSGLAGVKFAQLTGAQKDQLLKIIAVELGIIDAD